MSQSPARDDQDDDAADRVHGPAITGFMHRLADPEMERRYRETLAPQAQRRLVSLIWVVLLVIATRIGAPTLNLLPDPTATAGLLPRILQIATCLIGLGLLRKPRRNATIEAVSGAFVISTLATSCLLLPAMDTDGSVALLLGTVPLLYFGSPLRIQFLAPMMLAGSTAMLVAWTRGHPTPRSVAIFQVAEWLVILNLLGVVAMRLMRFTLRRQWSLSQALRHLATHDGLTGIANRRHYDQMLEREWRRCQDAGRDISVVLVDVDFFKLLNDGIGHAAGDDCLRDLAALLRQCVTSGVNDTENVVARTGGEEFACILPGAGELAARAVAERIAVCLRDQQMPHPGSPIGPHITVSLGVATARPSDGMTVRDLTGLADRLMYAAKSDGRDRIRQQALQRADLPALAAAQ